MNKLKIANTIGVNDYAKVQISEFFLPDLSYETAQHFENINQKIVLNKVKGIKDKALYNWNPDFLIEYIINLHHQPAKENVMLIYNMAQEILYQHNGSDQELSKLGERIYFFFNDFLVQMRTEEELLFPEIKKLSKLKNQLETDASRSYHDVGKLVTNLKEKQLQAIEGLSKFRKIINEYTGHFATCASFKNLYKRIKKFEYDLSVHAHVESNILFPKTLALASILAVEDPVSDKE